jgi:glycosyltransferase involved in cell wall biosynthesis
MTDSASNPRFSIVIPTCERANLLATTLPACLLTDRDDVEVLVSDNFSGPETASVIDRYRGDRRLRSVRTDRRLPMADHWEFAWQQARGEFIIINSDDDVISPPLLHCIDDASKHMAIGLASWDAGLYLHPDWDLSGANTFQFEASHTGLAFDIDPWRVIEKYARLNLVRCFPHGTRVCFSRQLAERARKRVGRIFWTPYPDYSASLLMLALMQGRERYVYFDSVLGYGGRSRNSNAAATVPKERGRAGNTARAKAFHEEHGAENMHADLEFQAVSLTNGHAQTLAMLRRLLPEAFGRFHLDLVAYIAGVECEFRGININNPWLGPEDRTEFDRFLARQDRAVVTQAFRIVEERMFNESVEQWRKDWRNFSFPVLWHMLRPRVLLRFPKRVLKFMLRRVMHPAADPKTASPSPLRADRHGVMVTVHCNSFGGRDGFDLARRIEEIVSTFDRRSDRNLVDFYSQGYMVAAHSPESFRGPCADRRQVDPADSSQRDQRRVAQT